MPGVVSLIEGAAGEYVVRAWELLSRELGIQAAPPGAIPHVSYHVAGEYAPGLLDRLAFEAACAMPFDVPIAGPAIFIGEPLVLYLAVTRSGALSRLQASAWQAAESFADESAGYWLEARWVPHITLAMEGLTPDFVAHAHALLLPGMPALSARIDNFALLDERTGGHELLARYAFASQKVQEA